MTDLPLAARPTRRPALPAHPDGLPWPTATWPTRTQSSGTAAKGTASAHVDEKRLDDLIGRGFGPNADQATDLNLAVVAIHRGRLVAEAYGPDTTAASTLISWSMGKSVTQAMVGLLVGDGLLDVDRPADVARWAGDERRAITPRDLLRMTSGLEFVEDYVDDEVSHVIEMLFGEGQHDVAAYAESFPLLHPPGTHFNYASGSTNIISALCGRIISGPDSAPATKAKAVTEYLTERLFGPIGMSSAVAKFDDAGTFIGSSFVYATAQDFARFGYLYLRDGVWGDQRLLPEGWAEAARTPVEPDVHEVRWYGEHWWLWDDETAAFACQGYEGQFIIVVPDRDLVLVRLGKTDVGSQPAVRSWLAEIIDCFPPEPVTSS